MRKMFSISGNYIPMDCFFECLPVAIALVDRSGRLVALNNMMASFSGLNKQTLMGRRVAEFSDEGGRNIVRNFKAFDEGREVPEHNIRIDNKTYHVAVRPFRDAEGEVVGLMVSLSDIPKIREAEQRAVITSEELRVLLSPQLGASA